MFKISKPKNIDPCFDHNLINFADHPCEKDALGRPKGAQIVDQFDAKDFMLGENGFRASDVAILFGNESQQIKDAVAARLVEIKSNPAAADLSDAELAKMAIPRNCQSPVALTDWMASLEHSGISKTVDNFIAAEEQKAAKKAELDAKLAELEALKSKSVESKFE